MRDWLSDFEAMTAEVASLRAENAKLKEASADLLRDWQAERAEAENLRDRVAALGARVAALETAGAYLRAIQLKEAIYRALTVQALRMRHEIYHGGHMGRDEFDRTYLNGLGRYERRIARIDGIPLDTAGLLEEDEE
jgi:cell division protein FtsB